MAQDSKNKLNPAKNKISGGIKFFGLFLFTPVTYLFLKLLNYFFKINPVNFLSPKGILAYSLAALFFIWVTLGIMDFKRAARTVCLWFTFAVWIGYCILCNFVLFFWNPVITYLIPVIFLGPIIFYLTLPAVKEQFS